MAIVSLLLLELLLLVVNGSRWSGAEAAALVPVGRHKAEHWVRSSITTSKTSSPASLSSDSPRTRRRRMLWTPRKMTMRQQRAVVVVPPDDMRKEQNHHDDDDSHQRQHHRKVATSAAAFNRNNIEVGRWDFLRDTGGSTILAAIAAVLTAAPSTTTTFGGTRVVVPGAAAARAFEGGIGGLGKTKPNTGVVWWDSESIPMQSAAATGMVTAELNVDGQPVLVSFQAPWPLLPTSSGLEVRDLQNSESAFVQVANGSSISSTTKEGMLQLLLDSVLSPLGKFGAYGAPVDVKVKQFTVQTESNKNDNNGPVVCTCSVTFTTFTPGLIESERQLLVKAIQLNNDPMKNATATARHSWILWVVGTTRQRFAAQQPRLQSVLDSFQAVPAPASSRSSRL